MIQKFQKTTTKNVSVEQDRDSSHQRQRRGDEFGWSGVPGKRSDDGEDEDAENQDAERKNFLRDGAHSVEERDEEIK